MVLGDGLLIWNIPAEKQKKLLDLQLEIGKPQSFRQVVEGQKDALCLRTGGDKDGFLRLAVCFSQLPDINDSVGKHSGKAVSQRLQVLKDLGLGYLTLGEETPSLSGGEAQRLKLASEMGKAQSDSVFVFDEPTIGLHPLDVRTLIGVFQTLIDNGATVIVIEHDLDVIRNADYVIDMGPGGGEAGGRIVAAGTPEEIRESAESITGKFL